MGNWIVLFILPIIAMLLAVLMPSIRNGSLPVILIFLAVMLLICLYKIKRKKKQPQ
jgi:L-asparagine transporter-like permease